MLEALKLEQLNFGKLAAWFCAMQRAAACMACTSMLPGRGPPVGQLGLELLTASAMLFLGLKCERLG